MELLTVFVVGPLAVTVCYDIAKKNPRANITMIILATAELYGGALSSIPFHSTLNSCLTSLLSSSRYWLDPTLRFVLITPLILLP